MTEFKAGPRNRAPTHPGKIIATQLEALGLTVYAAAPLLGVTKQALGNIVAGKSGVSPDMALRLGRFFDNGPELWMGLQADYDLYQAKTKLGDAIKKIKAAVSAKASQTTKRASGAS